MKSNLGLVTLALQISLATARIRYDLGRRNVLVADYNPTVDRFDEQNRKIVMTEPGTGFQQTFSCDGQGKELTFSPDRRFVACCFRSEALRGSPQTMFDCCGAGHDLTGSERTGYRCCPVGQEYDGRVCRSYGGSNQRPMNTWQQGNYPTQDPCDYCHQQGSGSHENFYRPGQQDRPQENFYRPGQHDRPQESSYRPWPQDRPQDNFYRPGQQDRPQDNFYRPGQQDRPQDSFYRPGQQDRPQDNFYRPGQSDYPSFGKWPNNNMRPDQCVSGLTSGKCYIFMADNGHRLGYKRNGGYYSAERDSRDHQFGKFQLCTTEACMVGSPINPHTGFHIRDIHGDANGGQNAGMWLDNRENGGHISKTAEFAKAGRFTLSKWPCGRYCLGGFDAGVGPTCPSEEPAMTFTTHDSQSCLPMDVMEVPCDIHAPENNCLWKNGANQCWDN